MRMMGRIFTFGCSFTNYLWPTWADILLYGNEGYNLGISGSGNVSMLYRVMEADRIFNFTKDDQIIIMFSTPIRWDIITGNPPEFMGYGQIISVDEFKKYENKLYTVDGLSFQSYYSIMAIKKYLDEKNVNHLFGSILNIFEDFGNYFESIEVSDDLNSLIRHIENQVDFELPSMFDFLIKQKLLKTKNWGVTKKWNDYNDYHPRPTTHYQYVVSEIIPKIPFELNLSIDKIEEIEYNIDNTNHSVDFLKLFEDEYRGFYKKLGSQIFHSKKI